ncbi:16S rRNA (guanine(966)-N(2))-methyltransferase RsmD [Undibacterium pigrum]|uniref:16S rRNA (Guanine(966)-N(2))-methyltransferase RsmD n=1 Tax=Undibacterium pigrum TaxID=401470 RepID=A0A318J5N8_9BURK|nr:16S rRNA (guanine(966)-N(2))-methyltransferase RsmD [Undibacterium pigrum]PXX42012.1 16S rRNA (guanine(966)-N(2))-methyltransferase RsmD [Undibacterium pigrum]
MKTNSNKKTKSAAAKAAPVKRQNHQIRIIGGVWKRSLLSVVDAEGLRPTPDRVRETLFNWLNHLLHNNWTGVHCLDLFAGSGALGFEAASRGAAQVIMVEAHTPAYKQLEQVRDKLQASQCKLLRGDALKAIESMANQPQKMDVIFLDPPFEQDWLGRILPACAQVLSPKGCIYVESEFPLVETAGDEAGNEKIAKLLSGWQLIRADKAGSVYFHILQRNILPHEAHENQA